MMTNNKFLLNIKITLAVKKRGKLSPTDPQYGALSQKIKGLEDSLRGPENEVDKVSRIATFSELSTEEI